MRLQVLGVELGGQVWLLFSVQTRHKTDDAWPRHNNEAEHTLLMGLIVLVHSSLRAGPSFLIAWVIITGTIMHLSQHRFACLLIDEPELQGNAPFQIEVPDDRFEAFGVR